MDVDGSQVECRVLEMVRSPYLMNGRIFTVAAPDLEVVPCMGFFSCSKLMVVDMPNVKLVDEQAFQDCVALQKVNMPLVESIGSFAFNGTFTTCDMYFDFPCLKYIGDSAFGDCRYLKKVNAPNLESMGTSCFADDKGLNYVNLGKVKEIPGDSFSRSGNVTVVGEQVESIGEGAFYESGAKMNMSNIKHIAKNAFAYDRGEMDLSSIETISSWAFYHAGFSVYFGENLKEIAPDSFMYDGTTPYKFKDLTGKTIEVTPENLAGHYFACWADGTMVMKEYSGGKGVIEEPSVDTTPLIVGCIVVILAIVAVACYLYKRKQC